MVLADSTRARPPRTEQDRKEKPRPNNRGESRNPRPRPPVNAARQPRAQAKPEWPTTDLRDGVEWQVPGLRPPAYRRPKPDHRAHRVPTRPELKREGEGLTPRSPFGMASLWYGGPGGRECGRGSAPEGALKGHPPFTFIAPLGLVRPMTRTHVRLLGPCFKTGRVGHRPFARRERGPQGPLCYTTVAGQPGHRRFPPSPCARRHDVGVPIQPGL